MEKAQFLYNDKSARHMLQVITQACTFIISLSFSEGKIRVAIDSCFLYIRTHVQHVIQFYWYYFWTKFEILDTCPGRDEYCYQKCTSDHHCKLHVQCIRPPTWSRFLYFHLSQAKIVIITIKKLCEAFHANLHSFT